MMGSGSEGEERQHSTALKNNKNKKKPESAETKNHFKLLFATKLLYDYA